MRGIAEELKRALKLLEIEVARLKEEIELWRSRARSALRAGREDLARAALERGKRLEGIASEYEAEIGRLREELRRAVSAPSASAAEARLKIPSAFAEYERLKEEVERIEAEAEELKRAGIEVEFRRLEEEAKVEGVLRKLKEKLGL